MPDYDKPKVPPATPPVIDPNVDPVEARELAQRDGDSDADGSAEASERGETNLALEERQKRRMEAGGKGEAELDAMKPETLLPPD